MRDLPEIWCTLGEERSNCHYALFFDPGGEASGLPRTRLELGMARSGPSAGDIPGAASTHLDFLNIPLLR